VRGRAGDDTISGGEGFDVLHGGHGRDTLSGGHGNDRLLASARRDPASDTVNGDEGDDRILVRDGHRDVVTCGPGIDRVRADATDSVAADCEAVRVRTGAGG
jgi:Ca2+-binding RTX toxin-like protein